MLINTIITNIHSQEEMDKVAEVLERLGNKLYGRTNYDDGNFSVIIIYDNGTFMSYIEDNPYTNSTQLTAEEFFVKYDKQTYKPKFKVGDRVRVNKCSGGTCDLIGGEAIIYEIDSNIIQLKEISNGFVHHACHYNETDLELVEAPQPLKNTIITNITSPEQHKRVQEKLFGMGVDGNCGFSGNHQIYIDCDSCIRNYGGDYTKYIGNSYPIDKSITASEFLGEDEPSGVYVGSGYSEPNAEVSIGDRIEPPTQTTGVADGMIKCLEVNINKNNPSSEPCVGKEKTKNMSGIRNFFKDLKVSNEDIELRKAGLKDENLNWTEDARQIVMDLEAQEEGYKNYSEMVTVVGNSLMSALELSYAFDNHYELLLETAKKYNRKDEKKNKK